jgi:superfamily II DNA or RNA helicase
MQPRWYQSDLIEKTRLGWSQGHQNGVIVSPPRSGKTPTAYWISEPFFQAGQGVIFIAHREELVRQLAMTYAEFGVSHNLIAPDDVISNIISRQVKKFGRSFVDRNSIVTIGSVQTIGARREKLRALFSRVGLWMVDEAHHILPDNMWGKVIAEMPNARGAGFTATPGRTDRKSLSRSQGGIFDFMVKGVTARQLIDEGFICDYRIVAPPSSIDRSAIKVGSKGDFTQKALTEAKDKSTITGDCVQSYLRYTPGQQAVVFAVDVEHAKDLATSYREAGVSAEMVSGKTAKVARKAIMDKFERGVFKVLVNVDLFGEGLNVEGIEVVIMARPTKSFVLYTQQFFRALTKGSDSGKVGTIIDHAGNVGHFGKFYGLPDAYNGWTLESTERGKRGRVIDLDVVKVTTCESCFYVYEAVRPACPHCGHKKEPAERTMPEQVAGDLIELSPEILAEMRGEIERVDGLPVVPHHLRNTPAEKAIHNRHFERQEAQTLLRYNITLWAGYWRDMITRRDGLPDPAIMDSEIHRRFYDKFGVDIMTAQTLNAKNALTLNEKVVSRNNDNYG